MIQGVSFFSHHQTISSFTEHEISLTTAKQLSSILPPNRNYLYLFGHEHLLAFYELTDVLDVLKSHKNPLHLYSRCIGNAGFPTTIEPMPKRHISKLKAYDQRTFKIIDGLWQAKVGYNGFASLKFNKNQVEISYQTNQVDPKTNQLIVNQTDLVAYEQFHVDKNGSLVLDKQVFDHDKLTLINKI